MKRQHPMYLHGTPWDFHEACPSCGKYFCINLMHTVYYFFRWLKWFCYLNYIDPKEIEHAKQCQPAGYGLPNQEKYR